MSHNKVVIFTENNARVLVNPENIEQYRNMPNALINPDLSGVYRLPPHLWKLEDGKVVKKGLRESINTIKHIEANGAQNDITAPLPPPPEPIEPVIEAVQEVVEEIVKPSMFAGLSEYLPYLAAFLLGAATATALIHLHVSYYL